MEARTIVIVAQELPWSPNAGRAVATVIAPWTPLVDQRRYRGGTWEVEASPKLIHNVYNSRNYLTGQPMADPCASILLPRPCVCLPRASFE